MEQVLTQSVSEEGAASPQSVIEADAVIVGAGPVGLFQVFELGLLEVKAHVIDTLAHPGGQCVELYPDKPIYDIPAVPVCTGQDLTNNLLRQIEPFGPTFHLGQEVTSLKRLDNGRFQMETSRGALFRTTTVFIAAGVGSFQPRILKIEGLERFEDTQVFYRVKDPATFAGKNLVVLGGGDSALDWALHFAQCEGTARPESVTLVHRRDGFRAAPASVARMRTLCDQMAMQFLVGQVTDYEVTRNGLLSSLKVAGGDGITRRLALDALLVFFGMSPKLGPIADWGLSLDRRQIAVDTEKFQTSVPGIFAVGDINAYPGKKKLILSGFHEAALAAFAAAPLIFPDKRIHLQYTTTSPKLHRALGVTTPVFD